MAKIHVVMIEPKVEGNIGAVARAMKNFGLDSLILVNPCPIGEEAKRRAMHAGDVLRTSTVVNSLEEGLGGMDLVIATSGIDTESEKKFVRIAMEPRELAKKLSEVSGDVAILFGREDYGLYQEELLKADILVSIPSSESYRILNVAHAAAIIFYEIFVVGKERKRPRETSQLEKEKLFETFAHLLDMTHYPEHKKERTKVMFRRLMGRALPSKWEFYALMGVLSGAIKAIKRR